MSKIALITGGSRGIGRGIAQHLAKEGLNLAINGIREASKVKNIIAELKASGVDVIYCRGDISFAKDRANILEKARKHYGHLDVLVNNAGIAPEERKDILESSPASFEKVLKVNLQGPYFLTQEVANWMIERKTAGQHFNGCIINVTSVSATTASVNRGEYCIAKAGLHMMTKLFAARLAEFDIPVYEIQPGIIKTDMTSAVKAKYDKLIEEGLTLQKRWGLPDDVGLAVAALVRGDFPYSTGQVVMVDGGLTLPRF
jgi:NAD(P)-dependent dehydrogenase (short-subunit alcohol dehydrogenase family)